MFLISYGMSHVLRMLSKPLLSMSPTPKVCLFFASLLINYPHSRTKATQRCEWMQRPCIHTLTDLSVQAETHGKGTEGGMNWLGIVGMEAFQ